MRSDAIRPGDVIGGKYRVRAILSRTRGFLVEAFHTEFDQRVVVRVLSPALCDEKEVERFRREARTLAKLESEHVARILDVGTLPDGAFFFARPYLEGTDLAAHLKKRGMLSLAEATLLLLQACEAIAETHVHNIILRELQPSHLFLTQRMGGEPLLKVIDFGTAKLMRENAAPSAGGELTSTSMFGLSCYSSPELVRKAKHVDVRTDVWSLGAIFYQMLSGRPPFDGEMATLMLQISRDDPPPLSRFRRDIPAEIEQIIGWAMAKDPDGRFANVHAMAHALTPFASPEGKVLIQRIGTIATAAKKRKKAAPGAGTMDPDHPETLDGDEVLEEEEDDDGDAPTRIQDAEMLAEVRRAVGGKIPPVPLPAPLPAPAAQSPLRTSLPAGRQSAPVPPPADAGESPFDRTVAISADFIPSSPTSPIAARNTGQPSPSVQLNVPQGAPPQAPPGVMFGGAAAGMPAPRPGGSQPPPGLLGPPMQFGAPQPARASDPPAVPGGYGTSPRQAPTEVVSRRQLSSSAPISVKPPPKGAKAALIAVAGTAVALIAVIAFVLIRGGGSKDAQAGAEASAQSAAASAASAPVAVTTASVASAAPPAAPPPTAEPVAAAPSADPAAATAPGAAQTGSKVATGPGPASPGASSKSTAGSKATATATAAAAPPPADADGMGTLVAVAVGGTCTFSVNGASKGTMAKLKVQVKAGTYSVTCKPSTGATKSKSVTIASGGTAMAMFKLE